MKANFNLSATLAILCILGTSYAHHHQGCIDVQRLYPSKNITCFDCYHRKPNAPSGKVGCGPLQSSQDRCAVYHYFETSNAVHCQQCKPGFAYYSNTTSCLQGTIQGCVAEYKFTNSHYCTACANGQYALTLPNNAGSRCIPASQVKKPVPNCLWGGVYTNQDNYSHATCARCKSGFALNFRTGACHTSSVPGCLSLDVSGKRCTACDVYDGYSMQPDFTCLKVGDAIKLPKLF